MKKLCTILQNKFKIKDPKLLIIQIKNTGYSATNYRFLEKLFLELSPNNFDFDVVLKLVKFISEYKKPKICLSYEPTYWMLRKNIYLHEAENCVNQYKKNKSTSKSGFVYRHGESEGIVKFKKFQKTSAYSSSDDWFIKKYGEDWELQKIRFNRKKSKRCLDYWINLGYSVDDAKIEVLNYQQNTSGVYKNYYEQRGYTKEEIDVIFKIINYKKGSHNRNVKYLKIKYPNNWKSIYLENCKKYRKRMEDIGIWISESIVDDFRKYKYLVNRYTNENLLFYGELLKNLNLRSNEYHLDHKYSIKMGFINDIDPRIVGSIINLEIVPASINLSKKDKCTITKNFLLKEYKVFKENYESKKD